ncbi:MAG: hypothetical protein HZA53_15340 [Planctomycetes bacterium]|nr:hypothetical protein [Planctomycetota bacterium]
MTGLHRLRLSTGVFARRTARRPLLVAGILGVTTAAAWAIVTDLTVVAQLHSPAAEHADQFEFLGLVQGGQADAAFDAAFEDGDELFETNFNALDGGGAKVGKGQRYTRVPRADLAGTREWKNHFPARATGPNAASCTSCHNLPMDDGAGDASTNVHRDPTHSANLGQMIQRNTPHTFALGATQRLAEEMTDELLAIREQAKAQACAQGGTVTLPLVAKGIAFGSIQATRAQTNPCVVTTNSLLVRGVSTDLVVRPFQWKGSVAFIRDFNRGASHNEIGMQAVEIVGDNFDGDGDGVVNEMTVGDQTALAIYLAAQPRPTSKQELNQLGLLKVRLTTEQLGSIERGKARFADVGCAVCHVPSLTLVNPIFSEPSQHPKYRDGTFPAGQNPLTQGVNPAFPVSFDLTQDQPDNRITDGGGSLVFHLGALKDDGQGHGLVELYGDLKRHDIGSGLAEQINEVGTGTSTFLTRNLWGVGSTAPYLHDGRATTLTEAILEHGGEATGAKNGFLALSTSSKADVIAFLDNLVLFKLVP